MQALHGIPRLSFDDSFQQFPNIISFEDSHQLNNSMITLILSSNGPENQFSTITQNPFSQRLPSTTSFIDPFSKFQRWTTMAAGALLPTQIIIWEIYHCWLHLLVMLKANIENFVQLLKCSFKKCCHGRVAIPYSLRPKEYFYRMYRSQFHHFLSEIISRTLFQNIVHLSRLLCRSAPFLAVLP